MRYSDLFIEQERKTIENDLPDKNFYMGYCHYFGIGRPIDKSKGMKFYLKGCEYDNPKCLYSMGVCSQKKNESYDISYDYYRKAFSGLMHEAENGDSISQRMISCYYLMGNRGVEANISKATFWVRKSALAGNPEAQFDLGESYYFGKGVVKDFNKAKFWLNKSSENGFIKAREFIAKALWDFKYEMKCLNLCDIALLPLVREQNFDYLSESIATTDINRVYIGSYFCSKYVKHLKVHMKKIVEVCKKNSVMITFVIPIISQVDLDDIKAELHSIISQYTDVIDEICVNDFAMLAWAGVNLPVDICLGRMFMKDPRDQRIPESRTTTSKPLFINEHLKKKMEEYPVVSIELDSIYESIECKLLNTGISLGIHEPYCYQTVGQMCLFASINKPIEKKFRANDSCSLDCMRAYVKYNMDEGSYVRLGRAVYYKVDRSNLQTDKNCLIRTLYWPLDIWEGKYEHPSAVEG